MKNFFNQLFWKYFTHFYSCCTCELTNYIILFMFSFLFQLKCCGYNYGNASDFPQYIIMQDGSSVRFLHFNSFFMTPLFCCYFNPLTQTYNSDFSTCTSPGGSYYRYSEVTLHVLVTIKSWLFLNLFFSWWNWKNLPI